MTRTTPPPSHRVADLFPALAGREWVTVRLHPRRGPEPPADATKLGGRIRWPLGEPWPACDRPHDGYHPKGEPRFFVRSPDGRPYVPVLQVLGEDVPELGFPPGADTFQLLWCPASHPELYAPAVRVFWWRRTDLADLVPPDPAPALDAGDYVPQPCVLHPERVPEYPSAFEVYDEIGPTIELLERDLGDLHYQSELGSAPGTKVGGHPDWLQDPEWPPCDAGHAMEHLLTVSDTEFDGASWRRWLPVEEAGIWDGPVDARFAVQEAAGLHMGMGSIYVFICRTCPGWPIAQVYQR
jgi:hypothetical protein